MSSPLLDAVCKSSNHLLPTQKCTRCSAEITFKTDPKNADYIIDNGATRNYEPWQEAIPNASADDEEPKEDEEDPMAMLEASQAASKRQMEEEDALADLRTRNARIARADVDSEAILAQQHANSALEAERARMEKEEEDEIVNQYFYKVAKPGTAASSSANVPMSNHKGKGKETKPAGNGVGLGGYGSDVVSDSEEDEDDEEEEPVTVTVKRGIVPNTKADAQPTVQDLLAARGIVLGGSSPSSAPAAVVKKPGFNLAAGGVKRKDLASSLGIKFAKKKKV